MVSFAQQPTPTSARGESRKLFPLLVALVAIVLVLAAFYFLVLRRGSIGGLSLGGGSYQAVFMTNGQVYFGKVAGGSDSEVILRDIYYLILKRPLQTQTLEATPGAQAKPEYTLIKLGQELHGPQDEMRINRDQVLFIEALKDDGKVAQAIKQFKEQPPQK